MILHKKVAQRHNFILSFVFRKLAFMTCWQHCKMVCRHLLHVDSWGNRLRTPISLKWRCFTKTRSKIIQIMQTLAISWFRTRAKIFFAQFYKGWNIFFFSVNTCFHCCEIFWQNNLIFSLQRCENMKKKTFNYFLCSETSLFKLVF